MRTSDSPSKVIYRVTVSGYDYRSYKAFMARVNVKASGPTAAAEWVLSYPDYAGLPRYTDLEILAAYKLKNQPVWLKKIGTNTARFDLVYLTEWKASSS
jgi:hypothetical protein